MVSLPEDSDQPPVLLPAVRPVRTLHSLWWNSQKREEARAAFEEEQWFEQMEIFIDHMQRVPCLLVGSKAVRTKCTCCIILDLSGESMRSVATRLTSFTKMTRDSQFSLVIE